MAGLPLEGLIRAEIAARGPMTFARFMELALYHPELGYYAGGRAGREPVGWSGDYFTSGDVHPLWGWCVARQLRQMWDLLGRPPRFDVVEVGAGRGLLARDVWAYALAEAPEWAAALRYTLVEWLPAGSPLREAREARLAAALAALGAPAGAVRWVERDLTPNPSPARRGEPEEPTPSPSGRSPNAPTPGKAEPEGETAENAEGRRGETGIGQRPAMEPRTDQWTSQIMPAALSRARGLTGCVVANELVDALPVHVVARGEGGPNDLREVYVDVAGGRLVERLGEPSRPDLAASLDRYRVPWRDYPAGWRAEVCLAAEPWMTRVASALDRGFTLIVDYGDTARRLYIRDRRRGTLMAYTGHRLGERPLANPGAQDLTTHVNFSALVDVGRAAGLRLAGLTTQRAFLERLGLRAEAEARAARLYPAADTDRASDRGQADYLRRAALRGAVTTLLDPAGLGGFRVLIQQRGVPGASRRLIGLA